MNIRRNSDPDLRNTNVIRPGVADAAFQRNLVGHRAGMATPAGALIRRRRVAQAPARENVRLNAEHNQVAPRAANAMQILQQQGVDASMAGVVASARETVGAFFDWERWSGLDIVKWSLGVLVLAVTGFKGVKALMGR